MTARHKPTICSLNSLRVDRISDATSARSECISDLSSSLLASSARVNNQNAPETQDLPASFPAPAQQPAGRRAGNASAPWDGAAKPLPGCYTAEAPA